ncbi:MAG TPA: phage portal protein [Dietzia sp.]|nr:phage portal protein [Dietzia sp.]
MSLASSLRAMLTVTPNVAAPAAAATFGVAPKASAVAAQSLPGEAFFDLGTARNATLAADLCMALPAVRAAVLAITGPISAWPLYVTNARGDRLPDRDPAHAWLRNPEPGRAPGWLIAKTLTDGIWHGRSVWRVTDRTLLGAPVKSERIHPNRVTAHPDQRDPDRVSSWVIDGSPVPVENLLVFDFSHLGGLQRIAWPILSLYADLMAAAANYARSPLPKEILKNTGADLEDDEIDDLLAAWEEARTARGSAYLNSTVEHSAVGWNAKELQLIEAREQMGTDVARTFGLPAWSVSAPSGGDSLTYANVADRRRDYKLALDPWSAVLTETLTYSPRVTPAGYTVNADSSAFTAPSPSERMATWAAGLASGALVLEDVRAAEPLARKTR